MHICHTRIIKQILVFYLIRLSLFKSAVFKSFHAMGRCYPNLYLVPCGELNFISLATPDPITARPADSDITYLLKKHIMSQTEETQKHLRNKVIDIYQTGKGYRVTSKALALNYPHMEEIWNSCEPSQL